MTSWDYFIGFEREPTDLDEFLDKKGYDKTSENPQTHDKDYEPRRGGLVDIMFFSKPTPVKEGEVPDWKKSGVQVTSDMMITTKDAKLVTKVESLVTAIVKKYDAVFYDLNLDEFFRKNQI